MTRQLTDTERQLITAGEWLALADWYDENGRPVHAAFIRTRVADVNTTSEAHWELLSEIIDRLILGGINQVRMTLDDCIRMYDFRYSKSFFGQFV